MFFCLFNHLALTCVNIYYFCALQVRFILWARFVDRSSGKPRKTSLKLDAINKTRQLGRWTASPNDLVSGARVFWWRRLEKLHWPSPPKSLNSVAHHCHRWKSVCTRNEHIRKTFLSPFWNCAFVGKCFQGEPFPVHEKSRGKIAHSKVLSDWK